MKTADTAIFVILYAVSTYVMSSNDFEIDSSAMLNDENYNYEDSVEAVEKNTVSNSPPKIISKGQEFIRNIGETVFLPCDIAGSSFVQVWRKRNLHSQDTAVLFQSKMRMAATHNMDIFDNFTIKITNLHIQDAGEYECLAMDSLPNINIQHRLILRTPPEIQELAAKGHVTSLKYGDTLVLTCKAKGYPKPTISWHRGTTRLDIRGETIMIDKVTHHNSGTYKCLADNKIGESDFRTINITIEYPPIVTVDKITVSSDHSYETELECIVNSEPRAQVIWTKNGANVVQNDRIEIHSQGRNHNLIIKNLQDSDFGIYICSATNALGSTKKNISLVQVPAIHGLFLTKDESREILTCKVQSTTKLKENHLWYKKKKDTEWKTISPEIKPEIHQTYNNSYDVKYLISNYLDPGVYEVKFRSENHKGISQDYFDQITIELNTKHGHHKHPKKGHKHGKAEVHEPENHKEYTADPVSTDESSNTSNVNSAVFVVWTLAITIIASSLYDSTLP